MPYGWIPAYRPQDADGIGRPKRDRRKQAAQRKRAQAARR